MVERLWKWNVSQIRVPGGGATGISQQS